MPKVSGLPEDTLPTADDFSISLDNASSILKKVRWSNLRGLFATKRSTTQASGTSVTPNADSTDVYTVTGLSVGTTIAAPTGTPTEGQPLTIRILDNGTAQSLAFNAIYRAIGITIPSATVAGKVLYVGCLYNLQDTKWDVVSIARQS
jgi:hypothetical protein